MISIDRSLLANEQREKFLKRDLGRLDNCLVWVQSKEGNVFGACIPFFLLGVNGISAGNHAGLLWWPQEN